MNEELKIGPIRLTSKALQQFQTAVLEQEPRPFAIRLGCKGGGCSGFLYVLEFIQELDIDREDDEIFQLQDLIFVMDVYSQQYLKETEIDFVSTLRESGFKFMSEQVKRTCGCGASFSN